MGCSEHQAHTHCGAVLMLFSQWKSADHIHEKVSWQKLPYAASTGGLVSIPQLSASVEPRDSVPSIRLHQKNKIIPWIYSTLITPLSDSLARYPEECICRMYRLHYPLTLKGLLSNLLRQHFCPFHLRSKMLGMSHSSWILCCFRHLFLLQFKKLRQVKPQN